VVDHVDHVVSNGCDVVHVAHCQCRLSFSRAEIVLINSWMPAQQIVYHMLRVFMKIEQLHIVLTVLWFVPDQGD